MTDKAAIAGNYADFKLVKTRSVAQVIIELPLEKAEAFLTAFGVPQPGAEKVVAIALLNMQKQPEPEKPKVHIPWEQMSYAQKSGILRNDKRFQGWLRVTTADEAAEYIRRKCAVESCSKIDGIPLARQKFDAMHTTYMQAVGLAAEAR